MLKSISCLLFTLAFPLLLKAETQASSPVVKVAGAAAVNQDILDFLNEMKPEQIDLPGRPGLYNNYFVSPQEKDVALVLVPGMGEAAVKYYEVAKDLKSLTAQIYVWDHIGQGTSSHFIPNERKKIHIDSFQTHISALENFLQEIRKSHKIIYVVAHSMGGHIILRIATHRPELIDRLVVTSPLLDFNRSKLPIHLVAWLLDFFPATYFPSLFTFFKNSKNADIFVTKSEERIAIRKSIFAAYPELERTGPTMGWLSQAVKSMRSFEKEDLSKITMPILILQADDDGLVSAVAQSQFCDKVPTCRLQIIKNSRHEILFEQDGARNEALAAIKSFIPL